MQNITNTTRRRGRPPKSLAGYSETRVQLIKAGVAILTERGLAATGIDEILRSVNVPKGSFYHYFASKEQYGLVLVEHYSAYLKAKLTRFLTDTSLPPLARLVAYMRDAEQSMQKYDFARGCLVGNLSQEIGQLSPAFRQKLMSTLDEWQQLVEACLLEAQQSGELGQEKDCKLLAYVFWNAWEGAVLKAKLEHSVVPLRTFAEFFVQSIR